MPRRDANSGEFVGEGFGMEFACMQNQTARLQRHFYTRGVIVSPTSEDRLHRPYVVPEETVLHEGTVTVLPEFSVPFHVASAVSVAVQRRKEQQLRMGQAHV